MQIRDWTQPTDYKGLSSGPGLEHLIYLLFSQERQIKLSLEQDRYATITPGSANSGSSQKLWLCTLYYSTDATGLGSAVSKLYSYITEVHSYFPTSLPLSFICTFLQAYLWVSFLFSY